MKSDGDVVEILEAFDLTGSLRDAAELAGCSPNTVARAMSAFDRAVGRSTEPIRRSQLIDPHLAKIEEWVERSTGKVRADVVHDKLRAFGFTGSERTTRRAVARAKRAYAAGHRRVFRPWIPEPGMWFQFDWGKGPRIGRPRHGPVVRLARLEPLPGRHPDLGPHAADRRRLSRRDAAPVRRQPDLCPDRQRADGDDRSDRRHRRPPPGARRRRPPLWPPDPRLRAGRPGVQGWQRERR